LINVGLTTLKGFPNLPNLKKLELSDNRISNGLQALNGCPKLSNLNLSGNKIKEIETLDPLKELSNLRHLDLLNCDITNMENYRQKVLECLPNVEYLDGFDRNDMEDSDEDDDGLVNGNGECSDEEDDDDDDDEVGLSYLQKSGLDEDSEGDDFEPGDDESEDEDEEEEESDEDSDEDTAESRGVKRKLPEDEESVD
jgi:acidic leucine-rich nuclear phosphoprotein 32 family protein A/C/D